LGGIAVGKSYEVEYCNLELRFDRRLIRNLIKALIQEGYSLYWNESEHQFIISIRSGRKLIKLKFERIGEKYKIVGNYSFKDEKLVEMMEKLIGDTRGHAIVKRFRDRQILIENIMFGKIIRTVEISGIEHKVLYQREPVVTVEEMIQAFRSKRAEERIPVLKLELDYELATLYDALQKGDAEAAEASKTKLAALRRELLQLEV
jgi:tRNA isopentenyl-2-thiomethyl-A-37 hydroxylase MiaE